LNELSGMHFNLNTFVKSLSHEPKSHSVDVVDQNAFFTYRYNVT